MDLKLLLTVEAWLTFDGSYGLKSKPESQTFPKKTLVNIQVNTCVTLGWENIL